MPNSSVLAVMSEARWRDAATVWWHRVVVPLMPPQLQDASGTLTAYTLLLCSLLLLCTR